MEVVASPGGLVQEDSLASLASEIARTFFSNGAVTVNLLPAALALGGLLALGALLLPLLGGGHGGSTGGTNLQVYGGSGSGGGSGYGGGGGGGGGGSSYGGGGGGGGGGSSYAAPSTGYGAQYRADDGYEEYRHLQDGLDAAYPGALLTRRMQQVAEPLAHAIGAIAQPLGHTLGDITANMLL